MTKKIITLYARRLGTIEARGCLANAGLWRTLKDFHTQYTKPDFRSSSLNVCNNINVIEFIQRRLEDSKLVLNILYQRCVDAQLQNDVGTLMTEVQFWKCSFVCFSNTVITYSHANKAIVVVGIRRSVDGVWKRFFSASQ